MTTAYLSDAHSIVHADGTTNSSATPATLVDSFGQQIGQIREDQPGCFAIWGENSGLGDAP